MSDWLVRLKNIGIAYLRSSHCLGLRDNPRERLPPLGQRSRPSWRGHGHGSLNSREVTAVPYYQNLPEIHSLGFQENCSQGGISLEALYYVTA